MQTTINRVVVAVGAAFFASWWAAKGLREAVLTLLAAITLYWLCIGVIRLVAALVRWLDRR